MAAPIRSTYRRTRRCSSSGSPARGSTPPPGRPPRPPPGARGGARRGPPIGRRAIDRWFMPRRDSIASLEQATERLGAFAEEPRSATACGDTLGDAGFTEHRNDRAHRTSRHRVLATLLHVLSPSLEEVRPLAAGDRRQQIEIDRLEACAGDGEVLGAVA